MKDENNEIDNLIASLKVSWWERFWLMGMILGLFFFEKYIEPDQAPFAASIALIIAVAHMLEKHSKFAKAIELVQLSSKQEMSNK